MGKVHDVPDDPNSVVVDVRCGGLDVFGRDRPERVYLKVTHHEGYGVLVSGSVLGGLDIVLARRALRKAGYDKADVRSWSYRHFMVDQKPSMWPFGLWVGGTPAVAFYFEVGV